MNTSFTLTLALAILALTAPCTFAADQRIVAKVGDVTITADQFAAAYEHARRQRFYHGAPPADQQQAFQREVADELIMRVLLLQEARRRGLQVDRQKVRTALDGYDRRYGQNPRWQQDRQRLLAALTDRLSEDDLLRQLEQRVRQVAVPDETQLRAYFQAEQDKFTEPARDRLSLILLRVDPSSPADAWQAAGNEARKLLQRLRSGADFAELARLHSADRTAANGGDMGYLHRGMLSPQAEQAIAPLEVGALTEPVRVLEGIAIFRLDERRPPRRHSFDQARERVTELWLRERGEQLWQGLRRELRATTPVEIVDPALGS